MKAFQNTADMLRNEVTVEDDDSARHDAERRSAYRSTVRGYAKPHIIKDSTEGKNMSIFRIIKEKVRFCIAAVVRCF